MPDVTQTETLETLMKREAGQGMAWPLSTTSPTGHVTSTSPSMGPYVVGMGMPQSGATVAMPQPGMGVTPLCSAASDVTTSAAVGNPPAWQMGPAVTVMYSDGTQRSGQVVAMGPEQGRPYPVSVGVTGPSQTAMGLQPMQPTWQIP